ncbi:MAG: hydrogenase [Methylomonas sp.]
MKPTLLEQLQTSHAVPILDAESYHLFVHGHRNVLLFFANDALLFPETHDVAVIFPELLKAFAGQLHGAAIDHSIERELQARFRFTSWPSLVLLRQGEYVGVISGIRDWRQYGQEIAELLQSEPSQPPTFDLGKACGASLAR